VFKQGIIPSNKLLNLPSKLGESSLSIHFLANLTADPMITG